jgi:hypothetical protein
VCNQVWQLKYELRKLRYFDDVHRAYALLAAQEAQGIHQQADREELLRQLPQWAANRLRRREPLFAFEVTPLGMQQPEVTVALRLPDDIFQHVLSFL